MLTSGQVMDADIATEFVLAQANWRDFSALRRLEKACFSTDDAWPPLDLMLTLVMPGLVRIKAVVNAEMAGFVGGEWANGKQQGWITTIGVLPQYRRMGIAQALLYACEAALHAPQVRLSVRQSNQNAIRMYLKSGYHQVDIWHRYYIGGEDAVVMEKTLRVG